MFSTNNRVIARQMAQNSYLYYGVSAYNGYWYVGLKDDLVKVGVVDVFNYWD